MHSFRLEKKHPRSAPRKDNTGDIDHRVHVDIIYPSERERERNVS